MLLKASDQTYRSPRVSKVDEKQVVINTSGSRRYLTHISVIYIKSTFFLYIIWQLRLKIKTNAHLNPTSEVSQKSYV